MKTRALLLVLVMLVVLAVPAAAVLEIPCLEEVVVPLRYGRTEIEVGSVTAWVDNGTLYVKYETTEDWYLTEIHLIAVTDLDDIPTANQPNNNNPIPGQFPVIDEFDPIQEYTAEIPLDEEWEEGTILYIMAHAALVRMEDEEVVQDEGAWGGEEEFDSTRFAFYFTFEICEGENGNGENGNGENGNGENGNGENGNGELPITGTNVVWLLVPGLALVGTGLAILRRRQ